MASTTTAVQMPPQPNSIIAAGKDKVSEVSPPRAKMRLQKNPAKVLKSPVLPAQDVSYWEAPGDLGGRSPAGVGAGAPRCRKRGYRPPDVRTIFEPPGKDPQGKEERGEGHSFCDGIAGAWCDHCCRYILHSSLVCSDCKYTCHPHCRDLVTLDCHQNGKSVDPPSSLDVGDHSNNNSHPPDVEKERELRTHLSKEEIRQKLELYNSSVTDHLKMTLNPVGSYTGFIKVQMELRRPITVRGPGGSAQSSEDAFYLPKGSINTLHISSSNTAREVIEALLSKFMVVDNPAKFALYKRICREDQVYVCKLSDGEHPLYLRLLAGPNTDTLSFVLREQQTGEWDAFSVPELQNFVRILDKEESDHLSSLMRRYATYRKKLEEALQEQSKPG
ncbi:ras association domain-containing protein 3-like isoform X1 [Acipenser ruthenus]|uniref:ras association domain-containing protein 3-like isoform X1 n=1 Tax=Acipenser ruthenus TaxID=7906 RepID=UPI0027413D2C|nr:ras association domain-containing protein 3-like isoform X1 [Acipenser ruthenus]